MKPPGTALGGRTKNFSLACSRMAWTAAHVFKPRACLPRVSCSQQCRVKAKQTQSGTATDSQFSLHGHKGKQWEQDQAGWSTGEQDPFLMRNGFMIHFSAVIKLAWSVTHVFAVPNMCSTKWGQEDLIVAVRLIQPEHTWQLFQFPAVIRLQINLSIKLEKT